MNPISNDATLLLMNLRNSECLNPNPSPAPAHTPFPHICFPPWADPASLSSSILKKFHPPRQSKGCYIKISAEMRAKVIDLVVNYNKSAREI